MPGGPTAQAVPPGFTYLEELGRGAHSTVVLARRDTDGADYAIKLLNRTAPGPATGRWVHDTDGTGRMVAALRREAALLAGVSHPQVVRVHAIGIHAGSVYMVLDQVPGRPLADLIARGPMPVPAATRIALDLAGQLAALHRCGLVHRDLKPGNILIQNDGGARLIDFGLATRDAATSAGDTVGTPAYAAPEQTGMLHRGVDGRSDLYSLGVVLYECLAGQPPFTADDTAQLMRKHAVEAPPDLATIAPGTPPQLVEAITRLLAKDPDDRFRDAGQLIAALVASTKPASTEAASTEPASTERTGLVGRVAERRQLAAAWGAAVTGQGEIVVLRGAPGAGKSALAADLAQTATGAGAMVVHGKSSPHDPLPLSSLRQALDELVATASPEVLQTAAQGYAQTLAGISPALARLLGTTPDADERQEQFAPALAGFLGTCAQLTGGLLLVLDDVQWLDPAGRRVLAELGDVATRTPLLVVVTARNDPASAEATQQALAVLSSPPSLDLTVGALSDDDVAALIQVLLPGLDPGSHLPVVVARNAGGNPFVAGEYVRAIVDSGLLAPSWGVWQLDEEGLAALDLPGDVIGLVLARVQTLSPPSREVLITAAAVGHEFTTDLLALVCESSPADLEEGLHEAVAHHLIRPLEAGRHQFVHDRIREALGSTGDEQSVRDLHQRIARAIASGTGERSAETVYALAHHLLNGDPEQDPELTRRSCLAAGQLALQDHSPAAAVEYLSAAVRVPGQRPGPDADLASLLLYGEALRRCGRFAAAREVLERARPLASEPFELARVQLELAAVHGGSWNLAACEAAIIDGLAALGEPLPTRTFQRTTTLAAQFLKVVAGRRGRPATDPDTVERLSLLVRLHEAGAYLNWQNMNADKAFAHLLLAARSANRLGAGPLYARSEATQGAALGVIGLKSRSERAFARAREACAPEDPVQLTDIAREHGMMRLMSGMDNGEALERVILDQGRWMELGAHSDCVSFAAYVNITEGRTAAAAELLALGQHRLAVHGDPEAGLPSPASQVLAAGGRFAEAAAELERFRQQSGATPPYGRQIIYLLTQGILLAEQNEMGAAFDQFEKDLLSVAGHPRRVHFAHRKMLLQIAFGRLAELRAAAGGHARASALTAAQGAVATIQQLGITPFLRAGARVALAELLVLEGKPEYALRELGRLPVVLVPDAPLLAFEESRTRARALAAMGASQASRRQVNVARELAVANGWPHRQRWIDTEFGVQHLSSQSRHSMSAVSMAGGTGREREQLRALQAVSQVAARVLDPAQLVTITLDETIRLMNAQRAIFFAPPPGQPDAPLRPQIARDAAGHDLPDVSGYSVSLVERTRASRDAIVVTGTEEGVALGAESVAVHGLKSIMVAPLELDGRLLGVVYLDSHVAKGIFTHADIELLTALITQIGTSLETARAAQLEVSVLAAQQQRDLGEVLRGTLTSFSATLDPQEVLDRLVTAVEGLPGCRGARLLSAADELDPPVTTEEGWVPMPLRGRSGPVGTLQLLLDTAEDAAGPDGELTIFQTIAAQAMTAYDNASLFAQVQQLSVVDELTGLNNRRYFFELAERDVAVAQRHSRPLAALMVDIDHFKQVNDTYGHPTGDDVIREVSARLAAQIRNTDVLGRYGGEEFALVLPDSGDDTEIAERMRIAVSSTPIRTRSGEIAITVSVGMAAMRPKDPDLAAVLARADAALYEAKHQGRNRVVVSRGRLPGPRE